MTNRSSEPPWHEDDAFWEIFAPALFGEDRWEAADDELMGIIQLTSIIPGSRILDLCCGPGRHSVGLARLGYHVTGVDRTGAYLEQLREFAEREPVKLDLVQEDMREFRKDAFFDLVINLFTSFSYFADPEDDLRVLTNMHHNLRPGGQLLMDLMSREVLARDFRPRDWRPLDDGSLLLEERTVKPGWEWVSSRWILVKDGRVEERLVEHRLYSAQQLNSMLRSVGFRRVETYGDLEGSPYDHRASRLVISAVK